MASYRFQPDLMAYKGAQYIMAKARPQMQGESDADYAKVPVVSGIFIPDKYNDINVLQDTRDSASRNKSGLTARASMMLFPMGRYDENLISSIKTRLVQNGEQPDEYNVPSHKVHISYSEKFTKAMRQSIQNQLLKTHPEWAGTTEETNSDLRRAISIELPSQLGLAYLIRPKEQAAAPAVAAPMVYAQAAAPVVSAEPSEAVIDDLPF